ncbi:putative beta-glucosidase [Phaeomoniella chlamydospora]|uniref:Probable beta-glucosidase I n=1 Tax=Phaeomoniella chlamydospora TaxID=158046 RepID=A0A0G2GYT0_PHACM|nr:putative beta-glucosidase [Phaeomoniella chlamydospora]
MLVLKQLDIEETIKRLTLQEKIQFLSGIDNWHLLPVKRLGIPSIRVSDGPNGVRGTKFFNGPPAACLPNGTGLAATWDVNLIRAGGELQGREAIAKGASVILGPTMNMQRGPLGGRGFESFSEDPFLAGAMGAATVQGIQSTGVAATVKHFVCNDQEHERNILDSIVTERALREIYTMPFQITQLLADPWAYMTSYGRVNGLHCSENPHVIGDIVRGEWGADVMFMSDWFGTYSAAESIKAGLDLEMPGPPYARGAQVSQALKSGKLIEYDLDCCLRRILRLINRILPLGIPSNAPEGTIDTPETAAQLRHLSSESIVLLKNENGVLPLNKDKSIAIIGPNAKMTNTYSGGGSASLNPYHFITPFDGISSQAPHAKYAEGCHGFKKLPLITNLTKTHDGKPGLTITCYDEPPSVSTRRVLEEVYVKSSDAMMFDFVPEGLKSGPPYRWYAAATGTLKPSTSGIYKFSLSVAGTGKLYIDDTLVIDNATTQTPGDSFFGYGTVEEFGEITLSAHKNYTVTLEYGSLVTSPILSDSNIQSGGFRLGCTLSVDPKDLLSQAIELAKSVDQVIIVAGLNADWESESYDRTNMDLPNLTDRLISSIVNVNPNTAVVIQSGTPVTMPWADSVPSILQAWYGGNETGHAIADVVFGKVNPSGKLPLSFPHRNEDNPAFLNFRSEAGRALYGEDVYIGYRFYEKTKQKVLFPFGHGLSYTTFSYSGLKLTTNTTASSLHLTVRLTNTGSIPGRTTLQAYVSPLFTPAINRPVKELKGFTKSRVLQPGESQVLTIDLLQRYATSYWDERRNAWCEEKGTYRIVVADSSQSDRELEAEFEVWESSWWNGL